MMACIAANVKSAMFISTDKAVESINLYGASKMCAEKLWSRGSIYSGGWGTNFAVVRYGNVIGSRGSILDMIKLLDKGNIVSDGEYSFKFYAMDDNKNINNEGTTSGKVIIDNDKPEITSSITNTVFSPNDDGNKDNLIIDIDIINKKQAILIVY